MRRGYLKFINDIIHEHSGLTLTDDLEIDLQSIISMRFKAKYPEGYRHVSDNLAIYDCSEPEIGYRDLDFEIRDIEILDKIMLEYYPETMI